MKRLTLLSLLVFGLEAYGLASPILRLDNGVNPVITICDNCAGDANPLVGAVTWIGTLGNWLLNVSTGNNLGAPVPTLDLNSVNNNNSSTPGTLKILFTDTGLTTVVPGWLMAFGGTITGGTVRFDTFFDLTNTPFGTGTLIGSLGPFASPPTGFAGNLASGAVPVGGPYSLTEVLTITNANRTQYSGDASIAPIPEPASLLMIGTGLMGLAYYRRKKFLKK